MTWDLYRFPWEQGHASESRALRHVAWQNHHIREQLDRIERLIVTDQEQADAAAARIETDLQSENASLQAIREEIAALQTEHPAVDFTSLENALADLDTTTAAAAAIPPAPPTP